VAGASAGARGGEVAVGWRGAGGARGRTARWWGGAAAAGRQGRASERRRRQRGGEGLRTARRQHLPCVGVLLRLCLREKSDASRAVARAGEEDGVFIPPDSLVPVGGTNRD
jgi:hypothetical protein